MSNAENFVHIQSTTFNTLGSLRYDTLFDDGNELQDNNAMNLVNRHCGYLMHVGQARMQAENQKRKEMVICPTHILFQNGYRMVFRPSPPKHVCCARSAHALGVVCFPSRVQMYNWCKEFYLGIVAVVLLFNKCES